MYAYAKSSLTKRIIHALFTYAMSKIYCICLNIYVSYTVIDDDVIVFNLF